MHARLYRGAAAVSTSQRLGRRYSASGAPSSTGSSWPPAGRRVSPVTSQMTAMRRWIEPRSSACRRAISATWRPTRSASIARSRW